jgi:hypothetical protein
MPPRTRRTADTHNWVDRAEYEALIYLRDVAHERVVGQLRVVEHNLGQCLAVNREQLARLTTQDMQLTYLRERVATLETKLIEASRPGAVKVDSDALFADVVRGRR